MPKIYNPLVSIVIPVYNGEDYLRESIDSALEQNYKNFEVIVVNDGSIDNTDKIARSYGKKIRYLKKENGGVASALNLALKKMKGEYFAWLSADDAYYPDRLEKQIVFLQYQKNQNIVLYSDYALMNGYSRVYQNIIFDHSMLLEKPGYALLRGSINGNTLLIPKKAFDDWGNFNTNLRTTQDYDKWHEISKTYKFIHIPEVLIKYRVHENQDTKKNPKFVTEGEALWIKMIKGLSEKDRKRLEGSEVNFYDRMLIFLKNTQYKKTINFVEQKLAEASKKEKKNKSSVAFVSHSAGISGAEKAMLSSIGILQDRGVHVHVVVPMAGPLSKKLDEIGVSYSIRKIRPCLKSLWAVAGDVKKEILQNAEDLSKLFEIIKPDTVISITSVIFEGTFAAKLAGIPHIWNISEYGVPEHGIKFLISEENRMKLLKNYSDKVFFVSESLREYYNNKVKLPQSVVIPPISEGEFSVKDIKGKANYFKNENSLKITLAGHISKGKGQIDAILAMSELKRKKIGAELLIVGPSGNTRYLKRLKNIIKKKRLDNVRIMSEVDDVLPVFQASDLVLSCSVWESFGRVVAEAMFVKKPVIGANSGATPELIKDDVNGFLYDPGNYRELAERIAYFAKNKSKLEKFGQKGYEIASEKFSEKKTGNLLLKEISVYKQAKIKKSTVKSTLKDIKKIMEVEKSKATDPVLRKGYAAVNKLRRLRNKIREGSK